MISKYFIWNAALQYQTLSLYVFASPSQKYADPIVTWDVNVKMTDSEFNIFSHQEYFVEQTGILFMVCQEKWVSQS